MKAIPRATSAPELETQATPASRGRVCMHVLGTARTDPRVMREATALTRAGYTVTVVDVEHDRSRGRQEMLDGVRLRHIMMPSWFISTRFKPWFLVKAARILLRIRARNATRMIISKFMFLIRFYS